MGREVGENQIHDAVSGTLLPGSEEEGQGRISEPSGTQKPQRIIAKNVPQIPEADDTDYLPGKEVVDLLSKATGRKIVAKDDIPEVGG